MEETFFKQATKQITFVQITELLDFYCPKTKQSSSPTTKKPHQTLQFLTVPKFWQHVVFEVSLKI